jgi:sugar transferase EpsL
MLSRIFFLQERIGYQNKPFYIFKLKTMRDLRDVNGRLLPDEQRVTAVGKFLRKTSLDELPQILNILKGDMRLVGPRPLLPEYLPLYSAQQLKRHSVKPGITGWAQVNGRNSLTWQEKFELDLWYVENKSWKLDLKIIWLTIMNIFKKQDGDEFAEKFNGKN